MKRNIGDEMIEALQQAVAYKSGEPVSGVKVYRYNKPPETVDVKAVRKQLGLTQSQFTRFGFTVKSIQNWETGKRKPEGPARVLLSVIAQSPEVVLRCLGNNEIVSLIPK